VNENKAAGLAMESNLPLLLVSTGRMMRSWVLRFKDCEGDRLITEVTNLGFVCASAWRPRANTMPLADRSPGPDSVPWLV